MCESETGTHQNMILQQVNRELMNLIESLQSQMKEENMGSEDIDDGADEEDDDLCDETDACIEVNMGEEIDGSDGKSNIGAENKNCDASAEILMEENDEKEVSKPLTDTNPQSPIGKEALDRHDAVSDGQEADVARGEMPKRRNKRKSAAGEETCTLAPNMGKRRGANKA